MKGLVSFHPVDVRWFDEVATPLVVGDRINPESFLDDAVRQRATAAVCGRFVCGLEDLLAAAAPPETDTEAPLWRKLRSRLETLEHRPDPVAAVAAETVVPELHLEGRPYLVTEGSADGVARLVEEYRTASSDDGVEALALEQLARLDAELARGVEPRDPGGLSQNFNFRRDVLDELRVLFDLPKAARAGEPWRPVGKPPRKATATLADELPWRAVALHARVRPFWVARDVDGLDTVCRACGIAAPAELVPAWRLFGRAVDEFPELRERLGTELERPRDVGAYVAPQDVPAVLDFLSAHGAAVIRAAASHGEGPMAKMLLKKVRECATYAAARGLGYLEASGIAFPHLAEVAPPDL